MTDLQVKYWTLKEQERANQAAEKVKFNTLTETERSNRMQEALKLQANQMEQQSIDNLKAVQETQALLNKANANLSSAQINKINAEIAKASAEIANINANTRLTGTEIDFYKWREINALTKSISDILGATAKTAGALIV